MSEATAVFPTDDAPEGAGPTLEVSFAGNLDWYVAVRPKPRADGLVFPPQAVRLCTSGGRNEVATAIVAALHSAVAGNWALAAERCDAAASLSRLRRRGAGGTATSSPQPDRETVTHATSSPQPDRETVTHARAWQELAAAVRNNALGDEPVGGVGVQLYYNPTHRRYCADFVGLEASGGADAPDLETAVIALAYLDEGESVIVGEDGQAVCYECDQPGVPPDCSYCGNTRLDQDPPHAWPPSGLPKSEVFGG